jgi:ParB family transcriptional regulator, chromosome partitioning protein
MLAEAIVAKDLSVRQAEALSRASHGIISPTKLSGPRPRPSGMQQIQNVAEAGAKGQPMPKDADVMALERTLSENLGMTVSITDRGQNGEVLISYESLNQLDDLLRRLGGGM